MVSNEQKDLWQLTASEVLPLLRKGNLKVESYVQSLVRRIQGRDRDVKAWVYFSPMSVLQQAQHLDDIPIPERGPLFGLPIAVKDVILTKDLPTQYNSLLFESTKPIAADANAIMSLRAAGAIIFGKTTTTEFATSKHGDWHQNHTANVYDAKRTPGGSSSGSGAAVGDAQVPIALGTQTGGSIIRPASFNGCYGLKPTFGALSREGIGRWCETFDTLGFFSRSADDFDPLLDFFNVKDDNPVSKEPLTLAGARFAFVWTSYGPNAGPGTQQAMAKAREILEKHGANVEAIELPQDFDKVLDWHAVLLAREGQTSYLGQYLTDKSKIHEQNIIDYEENAKGFSRADQLKASDNLARLRPVFDDFAKKYDAIITPSVVDVAPDISNTGDMNFCSIWTALHVPAMNIPGFAGENGLPIGLTAVTPRFTDQHLVHVAKTVGSVFEKEGGWVRKEAPTPKVAPRRSSTGYRSTG